MAGAWRQHEVFDGTYTFDDLLDWYEMRQVMDENKNRQRTAEEFMRNR